LKQGICVTAVYFEYEEDQYQSFIDERLLRVCNYSLNVNRLEADKNRKAIFKGLFRKAGDPNLSYFLIGPVAKETPAQGYGLVVVLPGGDGKADSLAYFIEHSPQDNVCPFRMAQETVRVLTAAGAKVQFNQHAGGHGWRGNIYPRIAAVIQWLKQSAQARAPAGDRW
jgi:hypothetical protein